MHTGAKIPIEFGEMCVHEQFRSCRMGDSRAMAKDGWTDLRCRDDVCLSLPLSLSDGHGFHIGALFADGSG